MNTRPPRDISHAEQRSRSREDGPGGAAPLALALRPRPVGQPRPQLLQAGSGAVIAERSTEPIVTWIDWLRGEHRTTGKVGLVGYSFGAGWALQTAITTPVDAAVLNVGLMLPTVKQLARLNGPMLGHFCDRGTDPFPSQVGLFESRMKQGGRSFDVHWYAADHAFLMPAHHDFNKKAADASWARTTEFLSSNLQ